MRLKSIHIGVIKLLAYSNSSKREVARNSNISEQTLYNWIKDADFHNMYEIYVEKFKNAVEIYKQTGNYDEFLSNLEIAKDNWVIISNLSYVEIPAPAKSEKVISRMETILSRSLSILEERLQSDDVDTELLIYLLDRFYAKSN